MYQYHDGSDIINSAAKTVTVMNKEFRTPCLLQNPANDSHCQIL